MAQQQLKKQKQKFKIKKGDQVIVLTGKDKGSTGRPVPLLLQFLLNRKTG